MVAAILLTVTSINSDIYAFPVSKYSSSSVLSTGKWVKIKVRESGMQFVSNSQLEAMGFTDPSKVNVYGYGGRMISETLDDSR